LQSYKLNLFRRNLELNRAPKPKAAEERIIFKKLLVGLLIASIILVAAAGYWFITAVPFGTLKLTETISDQSNEKHAAIFEYNHGDSSADVMAIWLLEGKFTEISENDLKGGPVVVWPINQKTPRIKWLADGRLHVEVEAPIDLRSQVLWDCYSPEIEPTRSYLCFYSNEIDLLVVN